jgi:gas vesicle protein GvpL/GvpF
LTRTDLVYLYAILAAPAPNAELRGIDERPVRWLNEHDLVAAVSDVPPAEFEEAPLNDHVRDLAWLEPRAVAHQAVNARVHELSPAMLPLAFGAVFRADAGVRDLLRTQALTLRARLDQVAGRSEWVVTLHRDEAAALASLDISPRLRELHAEVQTASPGRAHLLRRRLVEERKRELGRVDAEVGERLASVLAELADAVYPEPLSAEAIERPLWRASLLVARSAESALLRGLDGLRAELEPRGYRVLLTGPWPPYRFGGLDSRQVHAGVV